MFLRNRKLVRRTDAVEHGLSQVLFMAPPVLVLYFLQHTAVHMCIFKVLYSTGGASAAMSVLA